MAAPVMAAQTALQGLGQIADANSQAAQLSAQGAAAIYNAQALEQQANVATAQGVSQESQLRRSNRQQLAIGRAAAAQGGDLSGSAARVIDQNAMLAELDALNIRYQTDIKARGLRTQAEQERYQARVADVMARDARRKGQFLGALNFGVGTGLLLRNG